MQLAAVVAAAPSFFAAAAAPSCFAVAAAPSCVADPPPHQFDTHSTHTHSQTDRQTAHTPTPHTTPLMTASIEAAWQQSMMEHEAP